MTIQTNSSPSQSTDEISSSGNLPDRQKMRSGCTAILLTGTPMALMVPDGVDVGEYLCDLLPILDKIFIFDPFTNQNYLQRIEIDNSSMYEINQHDKSPANVEITDEIVSNKENVRILENCASTIPKTNKTTSSIKRPWE